jgi:ferredoxin-NADP reductase
MVDSGKGHDTVLYYCVNMRDEIAYGDIFAEATSKIQFSLIPVVAKEDVTSPHEKGYVTAEMITRRTPDFLERTWYISGPPGMVNTYKTLLKGMGVSAGNIKTDFFPGLA